LVPAASITINVVLQPDFQSPTLTRDKFLIMNLPVTSADVTTQELAELWKVLILGVLTTYTFITNSMERDPSKEVTFA
jgi:hypothetical protein